MTVLSSLEQVEAKDLFGVENSADSHQNIAPTPSTQSLLRKTSYIRIAAATLALRL